MNIEFLEKAGFYGGVENNSYLINMSKNLDEIRVCGKRVVLFGASLYAILAEHILASKGIEVWGYVDNSPKLANRSLHGKKIWLPDDLPDLNEYYFIITTSEFAVFQIRLQFLVNRIYDYSIFAVIGGDNFSEISEDLHKAYMDGINLICLQNEPDSSALPHCPYASDKEGKAIFPLTNVMRVTEWSHYVYVWANTFLGDITKSSMLEIGPGDGLFTYIALRLHRELCATWLVFGDDDQSRDKIFDKGLDKVKSEFTSRINIKYGMIEIDKGLINEQYHLIVMTEVFEHFALNPVNTMQILADSLAVDGRIALTTPNWGHRGPYKTWKDIPDCDNLENVDRYYELLNLGHVYQYDRSELEEIFDMAGLMVEKYDVSDGNNHNFFLKKKED